ncbi:DUF3027 domain-containing protein [Streptomyces sp. NPDC060194]|uniref:DUF3027 domain-containing protein n=1 Tax=Streptomyces sp. NPDC060194 TaxID=3347069 RepID=UPI003654F2D9
MRSRTPDRLCAEAVDLARAAAEEAAAPGVVGEHVSAVAEGDRVVTHYFEAKEPGYRGWRWAVTVARASRAKLVTLSETVLLPGPDALLAPEWVPWNERLRPGDMGPGDLLPTEAEDLRLERGLTDDAVRAAGADGAVPSTPDAAGANVAAGPAADDDLRLSPAWSGDEEPPPNSVLAPPAPAVVPSRASLAAVADELGMRRARVLSRYGLHSAADRWDESFGPKTPMAQAAPASCESCGFLVRIGGSLGQAFGVCANEFGPADGHVVSLSYGCGGHSEAAVMPTPPRPPALSFDSFRADPLLPDPDDDLGHA